MCNLKKISGHSSLVLYSNLIKWNWKLCKYAWMVRTAGRARTSETHASIIGNAVLFRDIGLIVGFPHSQIWNIGSFYMSSSRFLSSLISWKWQQLPLKYRTNRSISFQRDEIAVIYAVTSNDFFLSLGSTSPNIGAFLCKSLVLLRVWTTCIVPPVRQA